MKQSVKIVEAKVSDEVIQAKLKADPTFPVEDLKLINELYCEYITDGRLAFNLLAKFYRGDKKFKAKYLNKSDETLINAINSLLIYKNKPFYPAEKKDILKSFSSAEELIAFFEDFEEKYLLPAEVYYDGDDYFCVEVFSWEASKYYGTNSHWCVAFTSNSGYWDDYQSKGFRIFMIRRYKDKTVKNPAERFSTEVRDNFCMSYPKRKEARAYLCEFRDLNDRVVSKNGGQFDGYDVLKELSQRQGASPELKEIAEDWGKNLITTDLCRNGDGPINITNPPFSVSTVTDVLGLELSFKNDTNKDAIIENVIAKANKQILVATTNRRSFDIDINENYYTYYGLFPEFLKKEKNNAMNIAQYLMDCLSQEDMERLPSLEEGLIFVTPAQGFSNFLDTNYMDFFKHFLKGFESGSFDIAPAINSVLSEPPFSEKNKIIVGIAPSIPNREFSLLMYPLYYELARQFKNIHAGKKNIFTFVKNAKVEPYSFERRIRDTLLNQGNIPIDEEKVVFLYAVVEEEPIKNNLFKYLERL